MHDDRIWTAAELEALAPAERSRIVREGFVTDLSQVPPEFIERARAEFRALLEQSGFGRACWIPLLPGFGMAVGQKAFASSDAGAATSTS